MKRAADFWDKGWDKAFIGGLIIKDLVLAYALWRLLR